MSATHIPPEALEAAAIAVYISVYPAPDYFSWAETPEHTRRIYINHAIAAISAALNAWPGMNVLPGMQRGMRETKPVLILPLAQEPRDE